MDTVSVVTSTQRSASETYLQNVGKINQHVTRLLKATHDVKARGDYVDGFPALDKIIRDCEIKVPLSCFHVMFAESKRGSELEDLPASWAQAQ
jgi:hypothetical protein